MSSQLSENKMNIILINEHNCMSSADLEFIHTSSSSHLHYRNPLYYLLSNSPKNFNYSLLVR